MQEPEQPKKDRRGCPPGGGTRVGREPHTGHAQGLIGNPPFVPTDEQRAQVRTWAKVISQEAIAILLDVSTQTVHRHFAKEFNQGRAEAVAKLGADTLAKALSGSRRDREFYLRTQGARYGWSSRIELTGKDGGPITTAQIDIGPVLKDLSDEQLQSALPILRAILDSAGGAGLDPGAEIGSEPDRGGAGGEGT